MKILLFLNKDLHANLALQLLKEELLKHEVTIFYSSAVGGKKSKPQALANLEYYEKEWAFTKVAPLLRASDETNAFEFLDEHFSSFPLIQCDAVNSPEFIGKIKALDPDLFISIRFGKIFRNEIIQIPKKGILNLHSGLLPDYKGILGTLHALKEQRKEIACTLHYIQDKSIDTGAIIKTASLKVNPERSLFWHVYQLYPLGGQMLLEAIHTLKEQDQLPTIKQNEREGNYFSVPIEADFKQLEAAGFSVFLEQDYLDFFGAWVSPDLLEQIRLDLVEPE